MLLKNLGNYDMRTCKFYYYHHIFIDLRVAFDFFFLLTLEYTGQNISHNNCAV